MIIADESWTVWQWQCSSNPEDEGGLRGAYSLNEVVQSAVFPSMFDTAINGLNQLPCSTSEADGRPQ